MAMFNSKLLVMTRGYLMGNDMCIYVILDALDTGYVIVIHWICDFTVATRNTREKDTRYLMMGTVIHRHFSVGIVCRSFAKLDFPIPRDPETNYPLVNVYITMERSTIFHG